MKVQLFDSKIEEFIASLEKATIAKVLRTIDLLEMFGNQLGLPHNKKIKVPRGKPRGIVGTRFARSDARQAARY